jgi:hypothetical protein
MSSKSLRMEGSVAEQIHVLDWLPSFGSGRCHSYIGYMKKGELMTWSVEYNKVENTRSTRGITCVCVCVCGRSIIST